MLGYVSMSKVTRVNERNREGDTLGRMNRSVVVVSFGLNFQGSD
jgi:hypothetical protein